MIDLSAYDIIDLTHALSPQAPTWSGSCGFCHEQKSHDGDLFLVQQIKMHAGVGTHIDAPLHRFPGRKDVSSIDLKKLVVPVAVIDVSKKTHADYFISVQDILESEEKEGPIEPNSLVIGYTGWDKFWLDPKKYVGIDSSGQRHFPQFSKEAAYLLHQKQAVGIAIDTLSPDCLDASYPVHQLFLGEDKYIIENVHHANLLPARGSLGILLPLCGVGLAEAPIRFIALVPKA